ncbi:MAG TPA: type IV pilus secretin PilQ [Methylococcaceae bacterium]|jgi:type IV pilus assembly protein PilQ|nr:type IV pilus secretin PilQ [Methylococcaceae bacterium]HIB63482.1 type IV pilus secretin PilQ [Methylococcaceae bacterium]HIN68279.1 type IV pilus secretin PilQ [Methylococcales bacterium]
MSNLSLGIWLLVIVKVTMFSAAGAVNEQQSELSDVAESQGATVKTSDIAKLIPQRFITDISFMGGLRGKGRLLITFNNSNAFVNFKESTGQVTVSLLNTVIAKRFLKRMEVKTQGTLVDFIDFKQLVSETKVFIKLNTEQFHYTSMQGEKTLTINFTPVSVSVVGDRRKKERVNKGERLSLNFKAIEVRSVLQVLSDFTGLNIIATDSVSGAVTLKLNDVPWDQVLSLVLKAKGLAMRQNDNIVLVAPAAEIYKIEQDELASKKVAVYLEQLKTEFLQINYAKAVDIRNILVSGVGAATMGANSVKNPMLISERGMVVVDERTNTLIIKDVPAKLKEIAQLVALLDKPVQQVMIEARIVVADKTFAQEMGVKFGVAGAKVAATEATVHARTGSLANPSSLLDLGIDAMNMHPVGALGMTLARGADYVLNLELSALENENRGDIIANPRVMTSDRVKAIIRQGVKKQITVPATANNPASQSFVDVVLELNVTPHITPNGEVIMELLIKKDSNIANSQDFANREIQTTVKVKSGETIVLGGVYEEELAKTNYRVPYLASVPFFGHLFKKNVDSEIKKELLVFVTPKIVGSRRIQ